MAAGGPAALTANRPSVIPSSPLSSVGIVINNHVVAREKKQRSFGGERGGGEDKKNVKMIDVSSLCDRNSPHFKLRAISAVGLWYLFATIGIFMNKTLVKDYNVHPTLLMSYQLGFSAVADGMVLFAPEGPWKLWERQPLSANVAVQVIPVSLCVVFARTATYFSYRSIPVAISYTIKAASPVFNVSVLWLAYRKSFSWAVLLSLLPIMAGTVAATVSEFNLSEIGRFGVLCALLSTVIGVVQSIYTKQLYRRNVIDYMSLHFYNSGAAFLANTLYLVLMGPGGVSHSTDLVPPLYLFLGVLVQHLSSLSSYIIIGMVSELSYTVLNTLKRVAIIVFSIWAFGYELTPQTGVGISSAMLGIVLYNTAKHRSKRRDGGDKGHRKNSDGDDRRMLLPFHV